MRRAATHRRGDYVSSQELTYWPKVDFRKEMLARSRLAVLEFHESPLPAPENTAAKRGGKTPPGLPFWRRRPSSRT